MSRSTGNAVVLAVTMSIALTSATTASSPLTLSPAAERDHVARITTLAEDLDAAYLVAPNPRAGAPVVVEPGSTPEGGAASLAVALDLAPAAEAAVLDAADLREDVRTAMIAARNQVLSSVVEVQSLEAVENSDGTQTLTAEVYSQHELSAGLFAEEVVPYVVRVDAASGEYLSLDIQDDMGAEA